MLRNIVRYFCGLTLVLAGGMSFVGCSDDNNGLDIPQDKQPESGYFTISLKCIEGTRSDYTEEGLENLNENLIDKVTICLWSKGGDKPDGTAVPDYMQTFTGLNAEKTATVRIPLTVALKNKLFETSEAKCHVFAAVNVDVAETEGLTIADIRKMAIESEFPTKQIQDYFAMDGDGEVSYNPVTNAAAGNIDLQRSASKITLALAVDDIIEQNAIVDGALVKSRWKSDTSTMRVWLYGGLAESTLDPDMTAEPKEAFFFNTSDEFTYTFKDGNTDDGNNAPVNEETKEKLKYPFKQDIPFYTYPHRWSAEPDDYKATYMILSVPWMQVDEAGNQIPGSTWRTCYYQVPVIAEDSEILELIRNVSYHIYLHVGLLGSFEPDVPLELEELEYSAAQWGNVDIDVTIPDVRYLVVDQNDYTVNNETSIKIPFYTSHETIVTKATMTFYRYNYDDVGREMPVTVSMRQNHQSFVSARDSVFVARFDNATKELIVEHDLVMYQGMTSGKDIVSFTQKDGPTVTDVRKPMTEASWNTLMNTISYFTKVQPTATMTDVNEYSRVEFEITVQHKDMSGSTNFQEVINITQYPAMYITTVSNYCPATSTTFSFSGAQGNTFINGYYKDFGARNGFAQGNPSGGLSNGWTCSIGLSTGYLNFNPNLYLVTVTTLPEGTPYRIGDPRSSEINNYLANSNETTPGGGPLPTTAVKNAWTGTRYTFTPNNVWWDSDGDGNNDTKTDVRSPLTTTGFTRAKAIYTDGDANNVSGNQRTLSYYYPTLEDDAHKMMIAPKFRICSSYAGTTWILNRELARRRAAAYQELGYAAGRWRLPTFGEVSFVMQLAADFKIPRLFGTTKTTWYYWCANGLVQVPAKNNVTLTKPTLPGDAGFIGPQGPQTSTTYPNGKNPWVQRARFVYDEWYWGEADLQHEGTIGSADPIYTFTWGDKPY